MILRTLENNTDQSGLNSHLVGKEVETRRLVERMYSFVVSNHKQLLVQDDDIEHRVRILVYW